MDDDKDDMKPRRPKDEKKLAPAGHKPKLAASDPIFQLIWATANKELKRFVFFVNPFPNPEDYDLLPQRVYARATSLARQSGYRYTEGVDS